jgi:hypothetical protein
MKYEVVDNFLDEKYFTELEKNIAKPNSKMPWFWEPSVTGNSDEKECSKLFYMTHSFYENNLPTSNLLDKFFPLFTKLGEIGALIRVKANFYPNTEILYEHPMHVDYSFHNTGAILSMNTCDGYTKLEDGTKINSVANRLLIFDASTPHCSTTTTNIPARINININFIREQYTKKE